MFNDNNYNNYYYFLYYYNPASDNTRNNINVELQAKTKTARHTKKILSYIRAFRKVWTDS